MNTVELQPIENTVEVQPIVNEVEVKLIPVKMVQLGLISAYQTVEGVEVDDT